MFDCRAIYLRHTRVQARTHANAWLAKAKSCARSYRVDDADNRNDDDDRRHACANINSEWLWWFAVVVFAVLAPLRLRLSAITVVVVLYYIYKCDPRSAVPSVCRAIAHMCAVVWARCFLQIHTRSLHTMSTISYAVSAY